MSAIPRGSRLSGPYYREVRRADAVNALYKTTRADLKTLWGFPLAVMTNLLLHEDSICVFVHI